MRVTGVIVSLAALLGLAGCGSERIITQTVTHTVALPPPGQAAKGATLAKQPPAAGEIVVSGNTSPKTFGPYDFEPGTYTFRFQQYAPGQPGFDFETDASPFAVSLNRRPRTSAPDSQLLVNSAAKDGDNIVSITGRYYIDVTSADHSYVLRFTPRG